MDALILLVPLAIALGALFAGLFVVAAAQGQFDDLDDPPRRMLEVGEPEQGGVSGRTGPR